MKQVLIYLLATLISKNSLTQELPSPGIYLINNNMGSFIGDWQWQSGSDTLKLYLRKEKIYFPIIGGYFADRITGWHIYKKGNTIVENSYQYINYTDKLTYSSIIASTINNVNTIEGTLEDKTLHKLGDITLTLNAAHDLLTWKLEDSPGIKYRKPTASPTNYGFTLPENIVLTKL